MSKNILVIDDEELVIKSLTKLLEKNGLDVLVAKKGEDAIAMVEEEDFDLIIADIRMPGMNGVETIKRIYQTLGRKVPTIFITGYADKELKEEAESLNPIDYVYKPFEIAELVRKINDVIK